MDEDKANYSDKSDWLIFLKKLNRKMPVFTH